MRLELFFEKEEHGNELQNQANDLSDVIFYGWRRSMSEQQKQAFVAKCITIKYQGFLLMCTNTT